MERRVSVNDDSDPREPVSVELSATEAPGDGTDQPGWSDLPEIYVADDLESPEASATADPAATASHGPCLYLGTSGERCANPALAGGFCAKHHPDEERRWPGRDYRRVLFASIALIVILWPYIQDAFGLIARLVRELQAN
jgi:hypothetical protein